MSKLRKTLSILLIAALVLTLITPAALAEDNQVDRVSGKNRYETSAEIALKAFSDADNVIVVNGEARLNYADGLAASVLAKALNAPILLTTSAALNSAVKDAIKEINPSKIYILGGTVAVSEAVENELAQLADTERVRGEDGTRYATAVEIAKRANTGAKTAYVVNGESPADAMVAGAAAFANGYPILLVKSNEIPGVTTKALKDLGIENIIIVGGTIPVSQAVEDQLKEDGYKVDRIRGANRIETSVEFAKATFSNPSTIAISNYEPADAVAGSVFGAPVIFTNKGGEGLSESAVKYIEAAAEANQDLKVLIFGGTGAVSNAVENIVRQIVKEAEPQELEVVSVSAINAKQIQVVFNQQVEKTSAENSDNYKIQLNNDPTPESVNAKDGSVEVKLSEDGKVVTITMSDSINNKLDITKGTPFKFIVENVKSVSGKELEKYTTTLVSDDKTAPTLVTAKAEAKSTTTKVILEFSEPVQTTGAIAYVDGKAATVQAGTKHNEIVLTTEQALNANQQYELTLLNFKDYADNFIQPNPTNTTFTVVSDTAAPVVQDVKVVRDNLIEVTFNKAMDVSTFAGNTRVLDLNGNHQGGTITATAKSNTGNKTIRLALADAVPFNDNNTFVGTLVLGDGIKDTNGNAKAASSHSVTIVKDTVRPTITGATYVVPNGQYAGQTYDNGAIVVKFSEEVALATSTDIKLITSTGVDTSTSLDIDNRKVNTNNATEVIIPLKGGLTAGDYTLRMGNAVVKDLSTQENTNQAATTTVKVSSASDKTKPLVDETSIDVAAATDQTTGTTITVNMTDNVGLDLDTVQNVNNYLLNGKPLPSGSYITIRHNPPSSDTAATDIDVTINIPPESITKDGAHILNITNIKDKAGNTADPKTATVILADDVSPELKSATISSNGLLVLEFSEDVIGVTDTTLDDFDFIINGKEVKGADINALTPSAPSTYVIRITDGTGTDSGKYIVEIEAIVDNGADGNAATTSDNRLFIDINGNGIYDNGTDILVQTGTTKAPGASTLDIKLLSSLKVKVAQATTVTDTSAITNPIKVGTIITVK